MKEDVVEMVEEAVKSSVVTPKRIAITVAVLAAATIGVLVAKKFRSNDDAPEDEENV